MCGCSVPLACELSYGGSWCSSVAKSRIRASLTSLLHNTWDGSGQATLLGLNQSVRYRGEKKRKKGDSRKRGRKTKTEKEVVVGGTTAPLNLGTMGRGNCLNYLIHSWSGFFSGTVFIILLLLLLLITPEPLI